MPNERNLAPWLALAGVILGLLFQSWQFNKTLREQQRQSEKTAALQRDANEDAQWREALKLVSFKDQESSQVGVFAMLGFFSSPRYEAQARTFAGVLLTNIPNVYAFDQVMSRMGPPHTDEKNFSDLTSLAQMLGFAQRARFHIKGAASRKNTPFLMRVDAIEPNPKNLGRDKDQQARVAAWEIDTTSQTLLTVWKNEEAKKRLSPRDSPLEGVVLEYGNFDDLDFTGANFSFGILYNASFRRVHFNGATLKDLYVCKVALDGADFRGVTVYEGSKWEGSNWWDAKCVPQELLDYLLRVDTHRTTEEAKRRLVSNCH